MRQAIVFALCLSSCAKAQPFGVFDIQDLADPGTEEDLAAISPPDLLGSLPDLAGQDLTGAPPDLIGPPPDLSRPDLSGPPRDLAMADMTMPPADMTMPPADMTAPPTDMPGPAYPRINEVAPEVAGVALDEYIELVGGDMDTPLFGWSLWYQPPGGGFGEQLLSFPLLAVLPAHRYLLISVSGSAYMTSADHVYTSTGSGRLGPTGGAVALFNGLTKVDGMGWGSATGSYVEAAAAPAPGGQGCSRLPNGVDTDKNQRDFRVAAPTPRTINR